MAKKVSAAFQEQGREYQARLQAHKIESILKSFLFWLSFIPFQAIRIVSAAAVEAFREEADISGSLRLSSTLPRRTTAGQSRRTYQGPVAVVVKDKDAVPPQEDQLPSVKKQPSSVKDIAVQVDQLKYAPIKVPLGQRSGTSSAKTAAMQADILQRSPVTHRTDDPQQTKDISRKDHLQVPREALDAPYSQQSTAQDKIYVMIQPMPAPETIETPYFTGQNVSQFIERYERLCVRYHVTSKEKHQGLPEYCDY